MKKKTTAKEIEHEYGINQDLKKNLAESSKNGSEKGDSTIKKRNDRSASFEIA